jgi:hypothetical protein
LLIAAAALTSNGGEVPKVDAEKPTVSIVNPTTLPYFSTPFTIVSLNGTFSDNVGVTELIIGNPGIWAGRWENITETRTVEWSAPVDLGPGTNYITVTVRDAQGNENSITIAVTYTGSVLKDKTHPTINISSPNQSISRPRLPQSASPVARQTTSG